MSDRLRPTPDIFQTIFEDESLREKVRSFTEVLQQTPEVSSLLLLTYDSNPERKELVIFLKDADITKEENRSELDELVNRTSPHFPEGILGSMATDVSIGTYWARLGLTEPSFTVLWHRPVDQSEIDRRSLIARESFSAQYPEKLVELGIGYSNRRTVEAQYTGYVEIGDHIEKTSVVRSLLGEEIVKFLDSQPNETRSKHLVNILRFLDLVESPANLFQPDK